MDKEYVKQIIISKLCSRKFWVALLGFVGSVIVAFGMPELSAEQAGVIAAGCASLAAYIVGEGIVDAKNKSDTEK